MKMQKRTILAMGLALAAGGAAFAQSRTATRISPFTAEPVVTTTEITVSGSETATVSRPPARAPFTAPVRSAFRL